MQLFKRFLVGFGLVMFAGQAFGGCWIEWQGLSSRWVCDSAGARPTFESVTDAINEWSRMPSACKRAVHRAYQENNACGAAIGAGMASGGAVWVGAAYACSRMTQAVRDTQSVCRSYVNLRTKPLKGRACTVARRGSRPYQYIAWVTDGSQNKRQLCNRAIAVSQRGHNHTHYWYTTFNPRVQHKAIAECENGRWVAYGVGLQSIKKVIQYQADGGGRGCLFKVDKGWTPRR